MIYFCDPHPKVHIGHREMELHVTVVDTLWDQEEAYVPIYIKFFILTKTTTEVTLKISVRVQYVYTNNVQIRFVILHE